VRDRLRLYANYLQRLRLLMDLRGFPLNDELLQAVDRAYDEASGLVMALHYASSKSRVGWSPEDGH